MNWALEKLGFGERDRVVIIHADDIGMCQATLPAIVDVLEYVITAPIKPLSGCA